MCVKRLLPLVVMVTAVLVTAPSAGAQDLDRVTINAVAGLGGQYRAAQPLTVTVSLESETLVTGTLSLRSNANAEYHEVAVELPAGTRREITFSVIAPPFDPGPNPYRVEFVDSDGGRVNTSPGSRLAPRGVIAVLGALAEAAPENVTLAATGLTADVAGVRTERLSTPGLLGPASILVTESADLERLDEAALAQVLDWVVTGGQLVVDDAVDTVGVVPSEWQPGPDGRARAGRGMIIAGRGTVAAGGWDQLVAAPMNSNGDFWGGVGGFEGSSQSAARDAGLTTASVGGPLLVIVVYALVAGPVMYLLLRRRRRTGLIWLAVPALSAVVTGAIVATGSTARASTRFSHVAVVETTAGPGHHLAAVGATTPGGGVVRYEVPDGALAFVGDEQFFGGDQIGRAVVLGSGGGSQLALDVPAGGYTAGRIRGPVAGAVGRLTVEATADGDDIGVTVTNDTDWTLEEVGVLAGRFRTEQLGSLAPGESVDATLEFVSDNRDPYRPVGEDLWPRALGWRGQPDVTGPVAYSVFAEYLTSHGFNAAPAGLVTAVGWTRDADVPAGSGDGRTGVIGRSTIDADDYQPSATQVDVVDMGGWEEDEFGAPSVPLTMRIIPNRLPTDGGTITLALPGSVHDATVRRAGEWEPIEVTGEGEAFDMRLGRRVAIDPADCVDGICYLRLRTTPDGLELGFPIDGVTK